MFWTAEEGGTPDDDELSVFPRAFMDEILLCLPRIPAPRDAERDEAPAEGVLATFSSEVARIDHSSCGEPHCIPFVDGLQRDLQLPGPHVLRQDLGGHFCRRFRAQMGAFHVDGSVCGPWNALLFDAVDSEREKKGYSRHSDFLGV